VRDGLAQAAIRAHRREISSRLKLHSSNTRLQVTENAENGARGSWHPTCRKFNNWTNTSPCKNFELQNFPVLGLGQRKNTFMLWEKKPLNAVRRAQDAAAPASSINQKTTNLTEETAMGDTAKNTGTAIADPGRTQWGKSLVVKGDVSGNEDLAIFGQFEGSINLQDHCLTIGPEGKVQAEIHAARVVIHGTVHGNISVKERVEIYKSGHVVGDLIAPGISIEDGAYFKGKIEILRDDDRATSSFADTYSKPRVVASSTAAG
jgi:cytoskeletal protein CcmA (bactofilin family)